MTSFLRSDRSRPVAIWLFAVAALVLAMVIVGGATRLTDSGLSITEWRPVTGAVPPLSDAAWASEFAKYQQIPQYQLVNRGMSLEAFKTIYWWEWGHRLLGRVIGLAFAVPFVIFLALGRIPRRLIPACTALLVLGGLQGLIGWWMVSSGLSERVSVAPERLTVHLGLALIVLAGLVWTGLDAGFGQARAKAAGSWAGAAAALAGLVLAQSLLGALVAGNDAGLVYNDWPLMNGQVFPDAYAGEGLWGTLAHSQAAVQFNHRIGAYVLTAAALAFGAVALRSRRVDPQVRTLGLVVGALVLVQAGVGIATLMSAVPLWLGVLHQGMAAVLLAAATALAWRARRA